MLYYTSSINDFKVEYKINLTGLKVSGSKYTSSTTLYNSNNVSVDTNYYKENNNNQFVILDDDNNIKYKITEPVLLDSNFNEVETSGSVHTLKDNGNGTYLYTKYPASSSINNISSSVNYIDATTIYTNAARHAGRNEYLPFDGVHDNANSAYTPSEGGVHKLSYIRCQQPGVVANLHIVRVFQEFDTSAIENVDVINATHNIFGTTAGGSSYRIVSASFDDITDTSLYRSFVNTSGWDCGDGDCMDYSTGAITPQDQNTYWSGSLNSTARQDIVNLDNFQVAILNHHDWNDNYPGTQTGQHTCTVQLHGYPLASRDSYLEFNTTHLVKTYLNIKVGKLTLKGGKLIIK